MADVILKNILGQDVTYSGIDTVKLKNTEGGEETFSHGVAVEDVPINLELANGETQTITANEGELIKSAIVTVTGGGSGEALELEATELLFVDIDGMYSNFDSTLPILKAGATYDIGWGEDTYTCTAVEMDIGEGVMGVALGNMGDTEEPFMIVYNPVENMTAIASLLDTEETTRTVSIKFNFSAGGGGGIGDVLSADSYEIYDDTITNVVNNALRSTYEYTETRLKSVDLPKVTSIGTYAFYYQKGITKINLPSAVTIGGNAFRYCIAIEELNIPNVETLGEYALADIKNKEMELNLPKVTTVGSNCFGGSYFKKVTLPLVTTIPGNAFSSCSYIKTIDLPSATYITTYAFNYCSSLTALLLRSSTVATLNATAAFNYCYHILGTTNSTYNPTGAKDGYIYVPSALVDSYKAATNWKTYASQIRALESYTVDGTTTGELDESKI